MTWKKRSELKPGDKFAVECRPCGRGLAFPDVYVVIDHINEVGFWTGAHACIGAVAPGVKVLCV